MQCDQPLYSTNATEAEAHYQPPLSASPQSDGSTKQPSLLTHLTASLGPNHVRPSGPQTRRKCNHAPCHPQCHASLVNSQAQHSSVSCPGLPHRHAPCMKCRQLRRRAGSGRTATSGPHMTYAHSYSHGARLHGDPLTGETAALVNNGTCTAANCHFPSGCPPCPRYPRHAPS